MQSMKFFFPGAFQLNTARFKGHGSAHLRVFIERNRPNARSHPLERFSGNSRLEIAIDPPLCFGFKDQDRDALLEPRRVMVTCDATKVIVQFVQSLSRKPTRLGKGSKNRGSSAVTTEKDRPFRRDCITNELLYHAHVARHTLDAARKDRSLKIEILCFSKKCKSLFYRSNRDFRHLDARLIVPSMKSEIRTTLFGLILSIGSVLVLH